MISPAADWRSRVDELPAQDKKVGVPDGYTYATMEVVEYLSEGFVGTCIDELPDFLHALVTMYLERDMRRDGLRAALERVPADVKESFEQARLMFAPVTEVV